MEEIPTMYAIFILVMLTSFTECVPFTTIHVNEGDVAFLNFTYSCDSKEITLQRSNGAPFYNSRNATSPSSSNLKLRNATNGKICFLYLTINPVSRDNEGGYILTAYEDGPGLFEDDRILLLVAYPPGEASCVLSEKYIDGDWFMLHCTAPLGSIQGLIICYQDGIKIPPLNFPQPLDETLSQTLLAKVGSLVYCCSSILDETKDRCDCKDSVWDPTQNKQVTNVMDPCPHTVPIQHPTFSQQPLEDNDYASSSPSTKTTCTMIISKQPNCNTALLVVVVFLILVYIASIAGLVCYFKRYLKKSTCSNMENVVQEPGISDEERHLLCEASTNLANCKVEKLLCKDCASIVSGVKIKKDAGIDGYDEVLEDDQNVVKDGHRMITSVTDKLDKPLDEGEEKHITCSVSGVRFVKGAGREKYNGRIDGYDGELIATISVTDNTTWLIITGCIDECNVIISDRSQGNRHLYMLDMNTKHTQRVTCTTGSDFVSSCALLNDDKVVCGKERESCTGDSLTGCISVYDRQWKLIKDIAIPRNTTGDVTMVYVAAAQDGMIIAAEGGQSKIYVINVTDGEIMNTITCKQDIVMRGVLSSGHIIAQPCPADRRVFIIDREGAQREITHSDVILNVCIDPMTDDLYVVTSDDEGKTCVINQMTSGADMKKRRLASFPLSTALYRLGHLLTSSVTMTSSGNMIACDGGNILVFKKLSSN